MTPNFSAHGCTHLSAVAAIALRPSGACQRERFPLQVPRDRRWPRQRGSTPFVPGQAGRFVWRPGPRNGVGGLADDGGRAAIAAQFPSHERVNQTDDAQESGSASPQRATRPPLWPAGMAEGNRATFGPRVGLPSHGAPAKGGPKSKYLARVKIARTSAGPLSLTGPVPLFSHPLFSQYRTCPAFPLPALSLCNIGPVPLSLSRFRFLSRFRSPRSGRLVAGRE